MTTYIQYYKETLANTQQALYEKELLLKQEQKHLAQKPREHAIAPYN